MPASPSWLLCRVRTSLCALPLSHVIEVMRPLPTTPIANAPGCVLGMCVMRGEAVAVVDAGRCVLNQPCEPTRYVALRVGARRIALAVDGTLGAFDLSPEHTAELPTLLGGASDVLSAVSALDRELLLVLQSSRVVSELALAESSSHVRRD
ncbi:MAG: chemotaxis protein CheW [Polyangiales bacterium]